MYNFFFKWLEIYATPWTSCTKTLYTWGVTCTNKSNKFV